MSDHPVTTTPPPSFNLNPRQQRWLTALLVVATLAFGFVVVDYVGKWIAFFGDVIMVFFLAWLLAFILSPIANGLVRLFPRLPRPIAVIVVYSLLIVGIIAAVLLIAQQLYNSINSLVS